MGEAEVYFALEQRVDELQLTHRGGIIMAGVYFIPIKEKEKTYADAPTCYKTQVADLLRNAGLEHLITE